MSARLFEADAFVQGLADSLRVEVGRLTDHNNCILHSVTVIDHRAARRALLQ